MTYANLEVGQLVFYNHEEHSWILGYIDSSCDPKKGYKVKDKDHNAGTLQISLENVYPVNNEAVLEEDVHDLLLLSELHQSTLLNTLRKRYFNDVVYTYIGPIVIAINPFNYTIPWYRDEFMPNYLVEGPIIQKNKPHSWSVAHNTYFEMMDNRQNQSVLVSGESGAGKTEAVKIVIKYIKGLMMKRARDDEHKAVLDDINGRVLLASPILETFGNAKTGRNDNSSRFGKFLQVQFDGDGYIMGSFAINYLLEKSRVITAASGERVYHSFYQVAKGKDHDSFGIGDPKAFPSIFAGGCLDNASIEDAEGEDLSYRMTNECFGVCGVSSVEARAIWNNVAAVAHLAKTSFVAEGEWAVLDPKTLDNCKKAAALWNISLEDFQKELLTTTIEVRGEVTTKQLTVAQSCTIRDTVNTSVYKHLFDWIFWKLNEGTSADRDQVKNWMGLLDIFGFEDFKVNSFEQLCINLANETLQNHYNDYIFTRDMEECAAEGIDVTSVTFVDNTCTCELLIAKMGIFQILDDECALGQGTDLGFLDKVATQHEKHPSFSKRTLWKSSFAVKHYAGTVKYDIDNFLIKNKDILKDTFKIMFRESACELTKQLLPAPVEKHGRAPTVSGTFVEQIRALMTMINGTNPHWIRCIKPHPAKKPKMFHGLSSTSQMVSAGIIETVRIRMLGFPVRLPHTPFFFRFKCLSRDATGADIPGNCQKIILACGFSSSEAQIGKTKVFLKSHIYQKLEEMKRAAMQQHAVMVQRFAPWLLSLDILRQKIFAKNADLIAALKEQMRGRVALLNEESANRNDIKTDESSSFEAISQEIKVFFAEWERSRAERLAKWEAETGARHRQDRADLETQENNHRWAIIEEYEQLSESLNSSGLRARAKLTAALQEREERRAARAAEHAAKLEAERALEQERELRQVVAEEARKRAQEERRAVILERRNRRNDAVQRVQELLPASMEIVGEPNHQHSSSLRLSGSEKRSSPSPSATYSPSRGLFGTERSPARSAVPKPRRTLMSVAGEAVLKDRPISSATLARMSESVRDSQSEHCNSDIHYAEKALLEAAARGSNPLPYDTSDPRYKEYVLAYKLLGPTAAPEDVVPDTAPDVWKAAETQQKREMRLVEKSLPRSSPKASPVRPVRPGSSPSRDAVTLLQDSKYKRTSAPRVPVDDGTPSYMKPTLGAYLRSGQ